VFILDSKASPGAASLSGRRKAPGRRDVAGLIRSLDSPPLPRSGAARQSAP